MSISILEELYSQNISELFNITPESYQISPELQSLYLEDKFAFILC